jgi:hypothetical protein
MTLKQRLANGKVLLAPGVYDALTALVAQQAGFEALYLSGASIAYTRLGRSDIGLTTQTEVADTLARITERVALPVIVDGDTGFGNALNVQRTVREFERAGAAMVQLEDQTFPKRCGHLDGKAVVPAGRWSASCRRRSTRAAAPTRWCWRAPTRGGGRLRRRDGARRALPGSRRRRAVHRGAAHAAADGRGLRALRRPHPAAGQHGRRRQDAGAVGRRAGRPRLSHRHLSRAARRARWRTCCSGTTAACTRTAAPRRCAARCSTSTSSMR